VIVGGAVVILNSCALEDPDEDQLEDYLRGKKRTKDSFPIIFDLIIT